ncbi:MAG: hypothetical protein QOH98_2152 [Methylobacteriaceae bacterium]|nr:hypothetical protein [Methylobacteriaceae bacterium]
MFHLRRPPQRRRADARAVRQLFEAFRDRGNETVAHVLALEKTGNREVIRDQRRNVLAGMHREIDLVVQKREIEFLGEQALAAGIAQGAVLDRITARADDADGDCLFGNAMRMREFGAHLMCLRQRQRRAARPDS